MGNKNVLKRVERCLLNATKAMSTPEISRAVDASKTSVSYALCSLRAKYGKRLVSKSGNGASWHQLVNEAPQQRNVFVADLWRGWVNPITGQMPERLGL